MVCNYCGKTIKGKPKKVGPELMFLRGEVFCTSCIQEPSRNKFGEYAGEDVPTVDN